MQLELDNKEQQMPTQFLWKRYPNWTVALCCVSGDNATCHICIGLLGCCSGKTDNTRGTQKEELWEELAKPAFNHPLAAETGAALWAADPAAAGALCWNHWQM